MQSQGDSAEKIADAGRALARGEGFEGVQPATEFVKAWGEFMAGELSGLGLAAILGKASSWFAIGAKNTNAWDNAIFKADGDFGYLPPVRQNYVKDVYDLQGAVDKMRTSGASVEEVAKYAYGARNELKVKYREYTPPDMLDVIDARNLERYGNKIGPAFDDLVKKGKTLDQIIESSTRAGGGDLF
jgi:filamentous hemagglutinin